MKKPEEVMVDRSVTTMKVEDELVALILKRGKKHQLSYHELIGIMGSAHHRLMTLWDKNMQEIVREEDSKN